MRLRVSRARRRVPLRCAAAPTVSPGPTAGPVIALGGAVTGGRAVDGGGGGAVVGRVSGAGGFTLGSAAGLTGFGAVGGNDPPVPPPPGGAPPGGGGYGGVVAVVGLCPPGKVLECVPESGQPTGAGSRATNPPGAGRSPSTLTRCPSRLVRLALGFGVAGHRDDGLLVRQVDQAHAHSLPARPANLLHPGTDHAAAGGDREDLLLDLDDERTDQLTALGHDLRGGHALAATALDRVLLDLRPLCVATVGRCEHVDVVARDDLHGEQLVALGEAHADDAAGCPAHRPQRLVGGVEADRLRMLGDEQKVVVRSDEPRSNDLIVVAKVVADDAAGSVGVEVGQRRLLHQPVLGGEDEVRRDCVVLDVDDLRDALVRLEREDVGDVLAACRPVRLRQLVCLRPIDPALIREEQDPMVGRGHEEVLDDVVLLELRTLHTLAAALLRAIEVGLSALRITATRDGDDNVLFSNQVLEGQIALVGDDARPTLVAVLLRDLAELLADDRALTL